MAPKSAGSRRRPYDLRHACLSTWLNGGAYQPRQRSAPGTGRVPWPAPGSDEAGWWPGRHGVFRGRWVCRVSVMHPMTVAVGRRVSGTQKMRDGGDSAYRGSDHSLRRHAVHYRHIDRFAVA
jgi:hypothetical protein